MFRSNKLNLILAIVAAIAIWVYVVTFVNPTTEKTVRDIPVKLVNVEALAANGLTVSPKQAFTVDVEVRGPRSELNNLEASNITAVADMTGFPAGENVVDVLVSVPDGIELVASHLEKISVVVEELISVTKPVVLMYPEKFKEGIEPGFITMSPQEISVSGTRDMVDSIAVVGAEIDNKELSSDERTVTAGITAYDKLGAAIYGVSYSQDEIKVTARLCQTKKVPLKIKITGKPAAAREITNRDVPRTVTIRGDEYAISNINEITARDIDVKNIKDTTIFTPDLNLPEGVELADASQGLTVTVEIGGIEAKNIALTSDIIKIEGLPDDYSAYINTGNISVTIYGSKEQILDFKESDIKAFVNLSKANLQEESYSAKVRFRHGDNISRIECEPQKVRVMIVRATVNLATVAQSYNAG
jgi:YbbR domain-containing protein